MYEEGIEIDLELGESSYKQPKDNIHYIGNPIGDPNLRSQFPRTSASLYKKQSSNKVSFYSTKSNSSLHITSKNQDKQNSQSNDKNIIKRTQSGSSYNISDEKRLERCLKYFNGMPPKIYTSEDKHDTDSVNDDGSILIDDNEKGTTTYNRNKLNICGNIINILEQKIRNVHSCSSSCSLK